MKIPSIFAKAMAKQASAPTPNTLHKQMANAATPQQASQVLAQMQIQQMQAHAQQQHYLQQLAGTGNWLGGAQQFANAYSASSNFTAPQLPREFRNVQTEADLDHAVFKTPVETLINLWLAKYGGDWIDKEQVLDDEFFEWAAIRLRSMGRLEEHTVYSNTQHRTRILLRIVDKG